MLFDNPKEALEYAQKRADAMCERVSLVGMPKLKIKVMPYRKALGMFILETIRPSHGHFYA